MHCSVKSTLLSHSSETVQSIRKLFDLDAPGKMDEAVAILENWINMQSHFKKKVFNRNFLEMIIIQSKGSLERAKIRLDKYCTLKTMLPKYFEKVNVKTEFQDMHHVICTAVLPKLVGGYHRVCILKIFNKNLTSAHFVDFYRLALMFAEFVLAHDYFVGAIVVLDYVDVSIGDVLAANSPIDLSEAIKLTTECYGFRVKGFHIVSPSKLVHGVVILLRQVSSKKISERIYAHKNFESLFQVLPKDIFPEEYGGREKSLVTLRDEWVELLGTQEHIKYIMEMNEATTDEKNRDKYEFNSKYMGMPGTFRALIVD